MKMKLSEELAWRGLIKDKTFSDIAWLDQPKTFYLGTDVSSDSLQVGNLAVYLLARRLAESGWKTILLVGGATSLIGDPGGKDEERSLKSYEEVQANVKAIQKQVEALFSDEPFTIVNNYDWFKNLGYLEFLRDVGKHYSMTELLQRDFVSSRIGEGGSGISYAEFSYSLIQGYDYWWLFKEHEVVLQVGGSDQWGNMLSGAPLVRKKENQEVHALSMPLVINKATGKKFGKSEAGAVWLDSNKTSVYDFYQFWLNVDDEGVEDYLKIYTMLERTEIENLLTNFSQDRAGRLAQKTLAYEVTKIVHGAKAADKAKADSDKLFGKQEIASFTAQDFTNLGLQTFPYAANTSLIDVIVGSGLAQSNSEARRLLSEKGIYINDKAIDQDKTMLTGLDFIGDYLVLRRGKNTQVLIKKK